MSKTQPKPQAEPAVEKTIWERLAEPFPDKVLGWKPQVITGSRCLAVAYIDARDVMDRLDAVVGPQCWTDAYNFLDTGCVLCKLQVHVGNTGWIAREDVGGPSDQKDPGDRLKAAVSDALKRAAVKFGIGRYIYAMEPVWCDYDPQKKQIKGTPRGTVQVVHEPAGQEAPDLIVNSPTMTAAIAEAARGTGLTQKALAQMLGIGSWGAVEVRHYEKIMDYIGTFKEGRKTA